MIGFQKLIIISFTGVEDEGTKENLKKEKVMIQTHPRMDKHKCSRRRNAFSQVTFRLEKAQEEEGVEHRCIYILTHTSYNPKHFFISLATNFHIFGVRNVSTPNN